MAASDFEKISLSQSLLHVVEVQETRVLFVTVSEMALNSQLSRVHSSAATLARGSYGIYWA